MRPSPLPLNSSVILDAEYTPADLRSLVIQSLESSPIFRGRLAVGAICIACDDDTLVLNGRVPTYYLKQLLHETVRHVDGVAHVVNHVVVVDPSDSLATDQVCRNCATPQQSMR